MALAAHRLLCCGHLATGARAIGVLHLLLSVLGLLAAAAGLVAISTIQAAAADCQEFAEQLQLGLEEQFPEMHVETMETGVNLLLVLMVLLVLLSLLNLVASSLLLHGASVGRPSLLTPWLLLTSLSILSTVAAAAYCVLVHWHAAGLLLTIHLVITIYCLLCVLALRREQIKERGLDILKF